MEKPAGWREPAYLRTIPGRYTLRRVRGGARRSLQRYLTGKQPRRQGAGPEPDRVPPERGPIRTRVHPKKVAIPAWGAMAKRSAAMLNADLANMPAPTARASHPGRDAPGRTGRIGRGPTPNYKIPGCPAGRVVLTSTAVDKRARARAVSKPVRCPRGAAGRWAAGPWLDRYPRPGRRLAFWNSLRPSRKDVPDDDERTLPWRTVFPHRSSPV